ncbi:MAG: alanine racemase [Bacillota bacterium]
MQETEEAADLGETEGRIMLKIETTPAVEISPDVGDLWAEVDLGAVGHNTRAVRSILREDTRLAVVVKGDGYGHGSFAVASEARRNGATDTVVSTVMEGVELRLRGLDGPILVIGAVSPGQADLVVRHDLSAIVFTEETAVALSEAALSSGARVKVHLKVDTGLARYGVALRDAVCFMDRTGSLPGLEWEGVCTHLARSFVAHDRMTNVQAERFNLAVRELEKAGYRFSCRHIANSAALVIHPELEMNLVRIGNLIYGQEPLAERRRELTVRPAFRLFARVTAVRDMRPGETGGYGAEFTARRPTRVAVIPAGFGDGWGVEPRTTAYRGRVLLKEILRRVAETVGLDRRFFRAPNGSVQIGDHVCRVLGRVAMGQALVDVTRVPGVKPGVVAYLHCRPPLINRRVPRVYVRDGSLVGMRTVFGYATERGPVEEQE